MSNSTQLVTTVPMRGDLTIKVKDASTGTLIRTIEIRNKITFLAADVLVELIAQRATDPTVGNQKMYTMRMGTSNTAASRSDTNLGAPVIGKVLNDINKITGLAGELEFTATLDTTEANGNTLQEAGLFTKGAGTGTLDAPGTTGAVPRLFARQTHPPIPKTAALTLEYSWRVAFTA